MMLVKDFIIDAINELANGNTYSISGEGLDGLVWNEGSVNPPTIEQIQAKIDELTAAEPLRLLRAERDFKLAETDWWASSDLTMTAEQTAYRQALRDITDTYSSLDEVVWPTKPA